MQCGIAGCYTCYRATTIILSTRLASSSIARTHACSVVHMSGMMSTYIYSVPCAQCCTYVVGPMFGNIWLVSSCIFLPRNGNKVCIYKIFSAKGYCYCIYRENAKNKLLSYGGYSSQIYYCCCWYCCCLLLFKWPKIFLYGVLVNN